MTPIKVPLSVTGVLGFFCLCIIALLTGCSTATVSGTWKNERYSGGPVNKVLVLGVAKEILTRQFYELETVERFRQSGVQAEAASVLFQDKEPLEEEEIRSMGREMGFSHLLVTTVTRVQESSEKRTFVTSDVWYPYGQYPLPYPYVARYYRFPSWYPYYTDAWSRTRSRATTLNVSYHIVDLELNLYEFDSEMLVWTTVLEAMHHESVGETVKAINRAAFQELEKDDLLP